MKLIIPMAGLGKRMRPHTWSRPKPLLPIGGQPVLWHILERFRTMPLDAYVFVVGWLGEQIETYVRESYAIPAHVVQQKELLGQAHAVLLAREHLEGPLFLTFADTLFDGADLSGLDREGLDGVIYMHEAEDPRRFGVVETDERTGLATRLIEKPESLDNKKVLMGLYYFRDGSRLAQACEELIRLRMQTKGEYYISDAVSLMIRQGANFEVRPVDVWLDTGKPETTLLTHRYVLEHGCDNSFAIPRPGVAILPPVYIHPEAVVEQSVIGPYVSIGKKAQVKDSILRDAIVDEGAEIEAALVEESLIGRWAKVVGEFKQLNLGDSSTEL